MKLLQLRYFVAVAEERHFGRAAEPLHIALAAADPQAREPARRAASPGVELAAGRDVLLLRERGFTTAEMNTARGARDAGPDILRKEDVQAADELLDLMEQTYDAMERGDVAD